MAIIKVVPSINTSTGEVTNNVTGLSTSADVISGVSLRDKISSGARGQGTQGTAVTLNPSDNSFDTATAAAQGPILSSVVITDDKGTEYTVTGNTGRTVTFTPNIVAGAIASATYRYYTTDDIIYDTAVRPTNVTAVITDDGEQIILLKNGPKGGFSQEYSPHSAAVTTNGVISAILTRTV